jgi:hypothetical protein
MQESFIVSSENRNTKKRYRARSFKSRTVSPSVRTWQIELNEFREYYFYRKILKILPSNYIFLLKLDKNSRKQMYCR